LGRIPPDRARFVAARVEDGLGTVARDTWDAVILDPPRQNPSGLITVPKPSLISPPPPAAGKANVITGLGLIESITDTAIKSNLAADPAGLKRATGITGHVNTILKNDRFC